jgi:hypothetical protein
MHHVLKIVEADRNKNSDERVKAITDFMKNNESRYIH